MKSGKGSFSTFKRSLFLGKKGSGSRLLRHEELESRCLLSITTGEYDQIRTDLADFDLPANMVDINIIEITDLTANGLQNAINTAAQTEKDDLLLFRDSNGNNTLSLAGETIYVNIDSKNYGDLILCGGVNTSFNISVGGENAPAFAFAKGSIKLANFNITDIDLSNSFGVIATTSLMETNYETKNLNLFDINGYSIDTNAIVQNKIEEDILKINSFANGTYSSNSVWKDRDMSTNYAVIFAGGGDLYNNHYRYYAAVLDLYTILSTEYYIPFENIYILQSDGTDPAADCNLSGSYINSDVTYATNNGSYVGSATLANFSKVMTTVSGKMNSDSHLLVYTYDHGAGTEGDTTDYNDYLCGWEENLSGSKVAENLFKVKQGYVTTITAQCFSGGVIDDILDPATGIVLDKTVEGDKWFAMAAANHYETSWTGSYSVMGPFVGYGQSAIDALRITGEGAGLLNTKSVSDYAKKNNPYTVENEDYPNNGGIWGQGEAIEHPWGAGASFDIFAAKAESFTVDTVEDIIDPNDGKLSLREAINQSRTGDIIAFHSDLAGKTISITGELKITTSIIIDATDLVSEENPYGITLDAGNKGRIFTIDGNSNPESLNITLKGLALKNGLVSSKESLCVGGAIYAINANLKINDSALFNNKIEGNLQNVKGGAIFIEGSLSLFRTILYSNKAVNGGAVYCTNSMTVKEVRGYDNIVSGSGGAFYVEGDLEIRATEIYSNRAGKGGAIYSNAIVSITDSILQNNYASETGGAIYLINRDTSKFSLDLSKTRLLNNTALSGGAVYISGSMIIDESTFSDNHANEGGGIYSSYGKLEVHSSSFTNNNARDNGAGIFMIGGSSDQFSVGNSKFDANKAGSKGGGIYLWKVGNASLVNVTIAANSAAVGGGLYIGSEVVGTMDNSIVANNFAPDSPDIHIYAGQKIVATLPPKEEGEEGEKEPSSLELVVPGSLTLRYSLLGSSSTNTGIAFIDGENNLIDQAAGFLTAPEFDLSGNLLNAANYLLFLDKESLCVDSGSNSLAVYPGEVAILFDLVGEARINHAIVDMGAYEYVSDVLPDLSFYTPSGWSASAFVTNVDDYKETGNTFKIKEKLYLAFGSGNIGDAASAACSVSVTSDNANFISVSESYSAMNADEQKKMRLALGSFEKAGIYNLTITLDSQKTLSEKNKWNNTYTIRIIIGQEEKSTIVDTEKDIIDPTDGKISLREAILYAKSNDTITFANEMTGKAITLSGEELMIGKSITINASSINGVTIDGNGTSRIFNVLSGSTVVFDTLIIRGGKSSASGGGMTNAGTLTLKSCTITDNQTGTSGGGINNTGILTVNGGMISENIIRTGLSGGGIFNAKGATATIKGGCVIQNNAARYGGGIYNNGKLYVSATTDGSVSATFSSNNATYGGALYNIGSASLNHLIVNDNSVTNSGGGIVNSGSMTLQDSTIADNESDGMGGGISNSSGANLTIINTELLANSALTFGGALYNAGDASLINNTVLKNNVGNNEIVKYLSSVYGGAIYNVGSTKIYNSIIADNEARANYQSAGNFIGTGGGIYSKNDDLILDHSILKNNTAKEDEESEIFAPAGWEATDPVVLTGGTSTLFINYDSGINWDEWNLQLNSNAVAVNTGENEIVKKITRDKNGDARIVGGIVDLGAYEFQTAFYLEDGKTETSIVYTTDIGTVIGILVPAGIIEGNPAFALVDAEDLPFVLDGSGIKVNDVLENGTTYELKIKLTDDNGLDYTQSIFITAGSTPEAAPSETVHAQYGSQIALSAEGSYGGEGASIARYYWYVGSNSNPIITENARVILSTQQIRGDQVGLVVENEFGLKSEMVYTDVVIDDVSPVLTSKKTTFSEDHVVKFRFDVSLVRTPVEQWRINWGDGSDPQIINRKSASLSVAHYYQDAGQYAITLEIFTEGSTTAVCKYYIGSHAVPGEIVASEAPVEDTVSDLAQSDWANSPLPIDDSILDEIVPFLLDIEAPRMMNALDAGKSLWSNHDKEDDWIF